MSTLTMILVMVALLGVGVVVATLPLTRPSGRLSRPARL